MSANQSRGAFEQEPQMSSKIENNLEIAKKKNKKKIKIQ